MQKMVVFAPNPVPRQGGGALRFARFVIPFLSKLSCAPIIHCIHLKTPGIYYETVMAYYRAAFRSAGWLETLLEL